MTIQCAPEHSAPVTCQNGGPGFEDLIVDCLPELRGFVRRRMGPSVRAREEISDVVQSTCRELLSHRTRFQRSEENGFRRWLYTTALRKILNKDRFHTARRRDARREVALVRSAPNFRVADPTTQSQDEETLERLRDALARLPEDYRQVVMLSHLARLPRAEVAREMGRTENSVRNLLCRALASLGAELATHQPLKQLP